MSVDASPVPRPSPGGRRLLIAAGAVLAVLLVLVALLYLNRRAATRQVLTGWLEQQGIDADMEVERVELDGIVARVRIGDPAHPDVTIERVEVDYAIGAPWSKGGVGLTPSRIRLVRPVLRASLRGGRLTLGSLDPLVEKFTGRPPRPDSRSPLVIVEGARVRLDTDYGPANILGDARIDNGKLMRLIAHMPATAFKSGQAEARGLQAAVDLTTTGDRIAVRLDAAADSATLPGLQSQTAKLIVTGNLPYPDLKGRRGGGRAALNAAFTAARLSSGGTTARDTNARLTFAGQTAGWIESFNIDGSGDLDVRAARIDGAGTTAAGPRLRLDRAQATIRRDAGELGWRLAGPATVTAARASGAGLDSTGVTLRSANMVLGGRGGTVDAAGPMALSAERLAWGEMVLNGVRGDGQVDLGAGQGVRIAATASLAATRGSWPLFGPVGRDDVPELAGMKQALSAFAVEIPAFSLASGASGTRVSLTRPATLRPANGGVLTLRPASTPIFAAARGQAGGGALSLVASRGKGLPDATFAIPAWRLTPTGFTATLDGRAALDFGLARGIAVQTRGQLTSSGGRVTYFAAGCGPVSIERLELDANDLTALSGQICPADRPLASIADGRWRSDGAVRGFSADAPFLALWFRDVQGGFAATGGPSGIGLDARVASASVVDGTTPLRFNPLSAKGSARLTGQDWTGGFDLSRNGTALGRLTLAHDGATGLGGVMIDAPSIVFAAGGLQPGDLSPLAGPFAGSPATGSVSFAGRIDWRPDAEGTSSGRLTIPGLDFVSPAGPVRGLRGTVDFINLAPLTAAPGQRLTADRLESITPLTDVAVTFSLDKAAVTIEGGDLTVGSGRISLEPFAVPLDPAQPITGVIVLDKVQLGEVLAGSGFGDKVTLDAVVSGRLPFTSTRETGVRITGGTLAAVQPGRLSIAREALSGLEAGGGGEAVPPGTIQDLAYQAMENLSFDLLSAEVNSLDQGRIGVLFRIRGRHDPPQRQELRIPLADFISREFLKRKLPLPSGTGIDLTLDTTLNLNQLVGDLLELNRARNGQPAPTPDPGPVTP
ncbi:intermembrane phospholipid transport protein YdbH family protein [Brevundimonas sp. TWP2-3-4b2]|uniref:intermembrane phospholipid transport protein YdbH family protein n=1 Tax=Brevundimonas sp. TWP2-3-4b2 TaxID=2804595 RepID=UPI003CFA551D